MLQLRAFGMAEDLADRLLSDCERGFVIAVNEKEEGADGTKEP